MHPLLRLTPEEKVWNDYYTKGSRLGVLDRAYPATVKLSGSNPTAVAIFQTARRSRVWSVTWAGDVFAARVVLTDSTGERYTVDPCHIPLLSGHSPLSTRTVSTSLPSYPLPPFATAALHTPPQWRFLLEPNIVLPGVKQLRFEYDLENRTDPALQLGTEYTIYQVVHVWEFPGFRGSPR